MARWLLAAPGMRTRWLVGCGLVVLACSGRSERTRADESGGTGNAGTGATAQDETAGTKSTATGGTGGTHDDSPGAVGGTTTGPGSGDAGLGGEEASTGGTDSIEEPRGGSSGAPSGGHPGAIGVAGFGVAGVGGSGNGGWGGIPPSVCSLHVSELEPEPWREVTGDPTLEERFDYVRSGIVGAWRGVVTTPWTAPYDVEAIFTEDGHYSASCRYGSNDCCIAFYYGTDDEAEIKRYSIDDATLSGRVTGFIDIIFGTAGSYYEAGWQGELSGVDVDATGDRARFDFSTSDGYGPIHFELERTNTK